MSLRRQLAVLTLAALALGSCPGATKRTSAAIDHSGPGVVSSLSGSGVGDGGPALNAWLNEPEGVAVDGSGNLYIADTKNCVVRQVNTGGIISTVAGNGTCGFNGDSMPATSTELTLPRGVAVDSAGNLYIADAGSPISKAPGNCRIRKVGTDKILVTVAGSGSCDYGGDGGPATSAALKNAKSAAVDSSGSLYIADYDNCRIRKVVGGIISTAAGSTCDVVDPFGITIDSADNIYIADAGNSRIQLLKDGRLVTLAGPPEISTAEGVAVDHDGNLFIADTYHCAIKEIASPVYTAGIPPTIKTIAGNGRCGYTGEGAAIDAALSYPGGVAVDSAGDVFVADTLNCRIRKISGPNITTVAGNGGCHTTQPGDLAVDVGGNVFVSDSSVLDCHVLRVASSGDVSRMAGLATIGAGGVQSPCGFSGDGPATDAKLKAPTALALDSHGNLYVADTGNCRIRKVSNGVMATVVGKGSCRYDGDGGPAANASINRPQGVAVDSTGVLYVADTENCVIREIDTAGTITTVAGGATCGYAGDGGPASGAQLNQPAGIAVDAAGNVYVADSENCRVRKIDEATGKIQTIAGSGTCGYSGDGLAPSLASLNHPSDVAIDAFGQLFIADADNCRVREVSADQVLILTVAGTATCSYSGDGGPATNAAFFQPKGVAVDGDGNIFIADTANGRVRVVSAPDRDGNGYTDVQDLKAGRNPGAPVAPPPVAEDNSHGSGRPWGVIGLLSAGILAAMAAVAAIGFGVRRRARR